MTTNNEFLDFQHGHEPVDTYAWKPKEMDIFFRDISNFLPEGKTFADLTDEEEHELRQKYRFDPLYPGIYQGISGLGPTYDEWAPQQHSIIPEYEEWYDDED